MFQIRSNSPQIVLQQATTSQLELAHQIKMFAILVQFLYFSIGETEILAQQVQFFSESSAMCKVRTRNGHSTLH